MIRSRTPFTLIPNFLYYSQLAPELTCSILNEVVRSENQQGMMLPHVDGGANGRFAMEEEIEGEGEVAAAIGD